LEVKGSKVGIGEVVLVKRLVAGKIDLAPAFVVVGVKPVVKFRLLAKKREERLDGSGAGFNGMANTGRGGKGNLIVGDNPGKTEGSKDGGKFVPSIGKLNIDFGKISGLSQGGAVDGVKGRGRGFGVGVFHNQSQPLFTEKGRVGLDDGENLHGLI